MPAPNSLSKLPNSISRHYQFRSTKTGLVGLTPQTRSIIYEYLFDDTSIDTTKKACDEHPVLSVCKMIRNEAKVTFYKTAMIDVLEDSGPTFTSNIYKYSERVQLSCYHPLAPNLRPLDSMEALKPIHLYAKLDMDHWIMPYADEEQLLEAVKDYLDEEFQIMHAFAHKYPKASVDIESCWDPERRHSTVLYYIIYSSLESVRIVKRYKLVRERYAWTHGRHCGICGTRSVIWFLIQIRLAALRRRQQGTSC